MQSKWTWVTLFFVSAGILVALVLDLAFSDLFNLFRLQDTPLLGERFTLSTLLAVGVATVSAGYTGIVNQRTKTLVAECVVELNKVAWPTWTETRVNTVLVIVTSIVAAIILGVFDTLFGWLTNNNLFLY